MLKIKLSRTGKRSQPTYRIIVAEEHSKRDGAYTDLLGQYQPRQNPPIFKIDQNKYKHWLKVGAKPTDTVRKLVSHLIIK